MDEKRLQQQIAFILEADKEKNIFRQTHLSGKIRQENDAEKAGKRRRTRLAYGADDFSFTRILQ